MKSLITFVHSLLNKAENPKIMTPSAMLQRLTRTILQNDLRFSIFHFQSSGQYIRQEKILLHSIGKKHQKPECRWNFSCMKWNNTAQHKLDTTQNQHKLNKSINTKTPMINQAVVFSAIFLFFLC